jgi:predicted RNase H-like HicB family nuclease
MRSLQQTKSQGRAAWKRFASIFKTDWKIEDYPVDTRFHKVSDNLPMSRRPLPWFATVINWPGMFGAGETRSEALEDLRKKFEQRKAQKERLPRPGTKVPVQFATVTRVNQHAELAKDFTRRVLELEWAWVSDESSLGDFHGEETNDTLIQRIRSTYGVDVSDIPGGNLAEIFDRIAAKAGPNLS